MPFDAGTAWIAVRPRPEGWGKLKSAIAIAAPLAAVGAGALMVGQKFHEMRSAIIAGTGASGKALESLEASAKRVGKQAPEDFRTIGEAIAEMNTATGATGKPLEEMTKAVLNASRVLGEDGVANSKAFGRALNQWGVPAEKGAEKADVLFKATQAYGVGLGETTKNLSKYGATLQNAGFTMGESVELFGRLSKGGIDLRRAMPGLNMAFRSWAEEGKNGQDELAKTIKQMKNAESGTEALALATETFGAEGAQQLVSAARSGGLSLRGLGKDLKDSAGAIDDAEKRNRTFAESWQLLKNKGMAAVEPAATKLFDKINDGMSWLADEGIPTLKKYKDELTALGVGLGVAAAAIAAYKVTVVATTAATKAWTIATKLLNGSLRLNPIGLIVGALVLLVGAIVLAYKKSETFRNIVDTAWAKIKEVISGAWKNHIKPALAALAAFIQNRVIPVITWLWKNVIKPYFKAIGKVISFVWSKVIKPAFKAWWAYISKVLWPILKFLWSKVVKPVFGWIGDKVKTTWHKFIKPAFMMLKSFVQDKLVPAFKKGMKAIGNAWDSIKSAAKKPVNFLINTVYNKGIRGLVNKLADKIPGVPSLPKATALGGAGGHAHGGRWSPGSAGGASRMPKSMYDAAGGPFGFVKNLAGKGVKWLKNKAADAVRPLIDKIPGSGLFSKTARGIANKGLNSLLGFMGSNSDVKKAANKPKRGTRGGVLPSGAYRIGMPYLGYPGHYGADYPAATGTPVRSMMGGIVTKAKTLAGSYGKHVYVDHGDGIVTRYAHLNNYNVNAGSLVKKGQVLGAVGSTGNSTGPHLHFEYRKNGSAVNPASLGVFDQGGKLSPGLNMVMNKTRRPEAVLNPAQFANIERIANSGGGTRTVHNHFPTVDASAMAASADRTVRALEAVGI